MPLPNWFAHDILKLLWLHLYRCALCKGILLAQIFLFSLKGVCPIDPRKNSPDIALKIISNKDLATLKTPHDYSLHEVTASKKGSLFLCADNIVGNGAKP